MSTRVERGSVVVGVDGSVPSEAALDWAIDQATAEHRPLVIVHAAGTVPISSVRGTEARSRIRVTGRRITDHALGRVRGRSPDLRVDVLMKPGDPVSLLLEAAESASVVVLGSRGRGALTSLLLGSVSLAVSARAHCPVVVARPPADASPGQDGPSTNQAEIVVAVDGSATSMAAVDFAYHQASLRRLPLTVTHVDWDPMDGLSAVGEMPVQVGGAETASLISENLAGFGEKYPDVDARLEITRGDPAGVLVRVSEHAALVVLGSHGRGTAKALVLGSVSRNVVEHAHCSVAVVR